MQLLHYPEYKDHEVKALWEYIEASKRRLQVIGVMGPMHPSIPDQAVDLTGAQFHTQNSWMYQSVAFVLI